jgi:uncharacterized integral membrane protein (TIGR00698 family)
VPEAAAPGLRARFEQLAPGLAVAATVAVAAMFLSEHYGASAMLFALLLGMSLNFLSEEGKCVAGIKLGSKAVLRTGVALLGLRISAGQIADLGLMTVLLVVGCVIVTIGLGVLLARACSLSVRFGVLTAGAVAICGASAAMAIAAVLPRHAMSERDTSLTVIGVTALSTLAMIIYPIIAVELGLDLREAGVFLGATIHDVAQVVGAGYGVSKETGDTATIVKLLRVGMLLPVVVVISFVTRRSYAEGEKKAPLVPWFAVVFALLVGVNSTGWVPQAVSAFSGEISRWCLVTAIAAIGMSTSLKQLAVVGMRPVVLMISQTLVLAVMVVLMMRF